MASSPSPSSFWSLPDDLVENCVARVSRSDYPSLSRVSKSFRSLILSRRLLNMRKYLETVEECVFVCIQLPNHSQPSWYGITMDKQKNSSGNLLKPIPSSSYSICLQNLSVTVGSEIYTIGGIDTPCCDMWISNGRTCRKAPSMTIPRARAMNPHAVVLNEKIYVMGGCNEYRNRAEVFDTKTQTWESLPDLGTKRCFSLIKRLRNDKGKLRVTMSGYKHYCYDPEQGKWEFISYEQLISDSRSCWIENVMYGHNVSLIYWYDFEIEKWRVVNGMILMFMYNIVEITHHGGKLVVFFDDELFCGYSDDPNKKIRCAMVTLEKRNAGEVWGQIEWTDIVLDVPRGSILLTSLVTRI